MSASRPTSPPQAGGTEGGTVPRLDLAPKLKRPLQIWNPLDYARLLYWCFFFPQALRWYVEIFADPQHRKATGRDLLPALRRDRVQRDLVFQGLILAVLVPPLLAAGLQGLGVSVNWLYVALGVAVGVAVGVCTPRLPDYLVLALPTAWIWSRGGGRQPRHLLAAAYCTKATGSLVDAGLGRRFAQCQPTASLHFAVHPGRAGS